jgi:hypothetical protein
MGVNANSSQNKLWILIKFGTDILSQEMTTPLYLIPTTIILTLIIIIIKLIIIIINRETESVIMAAQDQAISTNNFKTFTLSTLCPVLWFMSVPRDG